MDINQVGKSLAVNGVNRPVKRARAEATSSTGPVDSVEISSEARFVSKVGKANSVARQQKVASIKAEVEAGTYLSAEKLSKAIDIA